jgi:RHS repeat-associated protein
MEFTLSNGRNAFGLTIENLSTPISPESSNRLTYNGKEFDKELNWYHYGARFYDPQVGRWWNVDAADEFYSPYIYVGNMPIRLIDPDGNMSGNPFEIWFRSTFNYFFGRNADRRSVHYVNHEMADDVSKMTLGVTKETWKQRGALGSILFIAAHRSPVLKFLGLSMMLDNAYESTLSLQQRTSQFMSNDATATQLVTETVNTFLSYTPLLQLSGAKGPVQSLSNYFGKELNETTSQLLEEGMSSGVGMLNESLNGVQSLSVEETKAVFGNTD